MCISEAYGTKEKTLRLVLFGLRGESWVVLPDGPVLIVRMGGHSTKLDAHKWT